MSVIERGLRREKFHFHCGVIGGGLSSGVPAMVLSLGSSGCHAALVST